MATSSDSIALNQQHLCGAAGLAFESVLTLKIADFAHLEETVKGIVAFLLFTQLMAAVAVLAAARLRKALGAPGVTPRQFILITVQMWLPTAITFVLVMNVVLEKWELRPLLAIAVLLLALLVSGVAIACLLLRRASRRAGRSMAIVA